MRSLGFIHCTITLEERKPEPASNITRSLRLIFENLLVNIIIYFIMKSESNLTMLNTFLVSEYDLLRE